MISGREEGAGGFLSSSLPPSRWNTKIGTFIACSDITLKILLDMVDIQGNMSS
jgi:hypothetical protein